MVELDFRFKSLYIVALRIFQFTGARTPAKPLRFFLSQFILSMDTVVTAISNPSANLWFNPVTVHIANAGTANDTVMLRVLGDFTNVPDSPQDVSFERETAYDTYPTYADTTFAIGSGGGTLQLVNPDFTVKGPYANPSHQNAHNVSILVHYPGSGSTITAQVYDQLGNAVGAASTHTSDGQKWDRIPINAPSLAGDYYIAVSVGGYTNSIGYVVN